MSGGSLYRRKRGDGATTGYSGRFVKSPCFIWGDSLPDVVHTGTLVIYTEFRYAGTFVLHAGGLF